MKICSVKFKNINSLQGEHAIAFDAPPLSESGLFLLTGATGAGKTSILDAICVALYGAIPRFKATDIREIMSRGTGECWSEVEFESGGKKYRSKWSVHRANNKPNSPFQKVKMELCKYPLYKPDYTGLREVPTKVAEITGLTMEQFLRSMMLAQGDFAAFLKAKENERAELLERIVGTDKFSKISKEAYEKATLEKRKLEELTSKIDESRLISEIEREQISSERQGFLRFADSAKIEMEQLRIAKSWRENVVKLENETEISRVKFEEKIRIKADFAENSTSLDLHRRALPSQNELRRLEDIQTNIRKTYEEIFRLEQEIPALSEVVRTLHEESENAQIAIESAQIAIESANPEIDSAIRMDENISHIGKFLSDCNAEESSANNELHKATNELDSAKISLAKARNNNNELIGWLEINQQDASLEADLSAIEINVLEFDAAEKSAKSKSLEIEQNRKLAEKIQQENVKIVEQLRQKQNESFELRLKITEIEQIFQTLLGDFTIENLNETVHSLRDKINQTLRLKEYSEQFSTKILRRNSLREEYKIGKDKTVILSQRTSELEEQIQRSEEKLADIRRIFDLEKKIQNYEQARADLHPDEACPLCGSTHHPFAESYSSALSSAESDVKAQEIHLKNLQKDLLENQQTFASLNAIQEAKEQEGKGITEEIERLEKQFSEISEKIGITNEVGENQSLADKIQEFQELEKQLSEQYLAVTELKKNWEKLKETVQIRETECTQAKNELEKTEIKAGENQANFAKLTIELSDRKFDSEQRKNRLNALLEKYSVEKSSETLKILKNRAQIWQNHSKEKISIQTEIATLQGNRNGLENQISDRKKSLDSIILKIQAENERLTIAKNERFAKFGDKNPTEERELLNLSFKNASKIFDLVQKRLQPVAEQFSNANVKLATRQNDAEKLVFDEKNVFEKLGNLAIQSGFSSIDALHEALLSDEVFQKLEHEEKEIHEELARVGHLLAENQKRLLAEQNQAITAETSDELSEKIGMKEREISELEQKLGAIEERLRIDAKLRTEFAEMTKGIEIQRKEWNRWEKLNELIGSSNGDKFRKFAQGLTLVRLTDLANQHLKLLSDRYSLEKIKGKDLALQIIDSYLADERRAVESLSGGETFLVSLALALGLSDLASAKTQIDSLFIDEGFGTLDAETLEIAMSALDNIQATGKTIGIISHVETMKDRIATQIKVIKKGEGMSEIQVV